MRVGKVLFGSLSEKIHYINIYLVQSKLFFPRKKKAENERTKKTTLLQAQETREFPKPTPILSSVFPSVVPSFPFLSYVLVCLLACFLSFFFRSFFMACSSFESFHSHVSQELSKEISMSHIKTQHS